MVAFSDGLKCASGKKILENLVRDEGTCWDVYPENWNVSFLNFIFESLSVVIWGIPESKDGWWLETITCTLTIFHSKGLLFAVFLAKHYPWNALNTWQEHIHYPMLSRSFSKNSFEKRIFHSAGFEARVFVDFGIPRWPVVHLPEAAHGLVFRAVHLVILVHNSPSQYDLTWWRSMLGCS